MAHNHDPMHTSGRDDTPERTTEQRSTGVARREGGRSTSKPAGGRTPSGAATGKPRFKPTQHIVGPLWWQN